MAIRYAGIPPPLHCLITYVKAIRVSCKMRAVQQLEEGGGVLKGWGWGCERAWNESPRHKFKYLNLFQQTILSRRYFMTNLRAYNLRGLGILQFSLRRISRLLVYKYNIYRRVKICTQGKYRQMYSQNSTVHLGNQLFVVMKVVSPSPKIVRIYHSEPCLSFNCGCY